MRLFSTLWSFVQARPDRSGAANSTKPRLESLEDRLVPAANNHDFVASAEKALANRNFNPAFDNGLVAALDAHQINPAVGYSPLDVTAIIQSTDDAIHTQVVRLYQQLLIRNPVPGENFFDAILKGGATLQTAKIIMMASPEYYNRMGGGTDNGYISALFADQLGRQVDPLGQQFYSLILDNDPTNNIFPPAPDVPFDASNPFNQRYETARYIVNSSEGANSETRFLFNAYLGRPADNFGAPIFISQLIAFAGFPQTPTAEQTVIAIMVSSPEFFDKS